MNRAERRLAQHPRGERTVVRHEIPVNAAETWGDDRSEPSTAAASSTSDASPPASFLAKLRRRRRDPRPGPCHSCGCCASWTTALRLLAVEIRAHVARQHRPFACRADCLVCGPDADAWLGTITKEP